MAYEKSGLFDLTNTSMCDFTEFEETVICWLLIKSPFAMNPDQSGASMLMYFIYIGFPKSQKYELRNIKWKLLLICMSIFSYICA